MKKDNSSYYHKVLLRRRAVAAVGGPGKARVLDLYAGRGEMRRRAWNDVALYLGLDKRFGRPGECVKCDNRKSLAAALARGRWNIFDLDAWGNPWPLLVRLSRLVGTGKYQLVLTDGINKEMRMNPGRELERVICWDLGWEKYGLLTRFNPRLHDDIVSWYLGESDFIPINGEYFSAPDIGWRPRYYLIEVKK